AERRKSKMEAAKGAPGEDPRFRERVGAVVAELIREAKPDTGRLEPAMNIELDLGFDSLARVELLGLAEARLGTHIDEQQASRIFTLGELIDAFEGASASEMVVGRSWKEILETATPVTPGEDYVFNKRPLLDPVSLLAMRG